MLQLFFYNVGNGGKVASCLQSFNSVEWISCVRLIMTLWNAACQASLSNTNFRTLFKLMSNEWVMPLNHFILSRPILPLPSIFPSIRVFSKQAVLCIRWPQCWSFSFSISPSKEYSGLISFRMDWLDLLAVQGGLTRVFSNTTIQKHQFIGAQLLFTPTLTWIHDYWKSHSFD